MLDDRAHAAGAGAALAAFARISERLLIGLLADRHALQADAEPRRIHHHEHRRQAAVLLADQIGGCAARIAIDHHASRRSVNAELVLDRGAAQVVAAPERAVRIDQEFRRQEQRDAARAGRSVGQARQHEMDDVVGHVVFAVGDEDLLAGEAIAPVRRALGARLDRGEVRAGLRLGQVHRSGPFAGNEALEIDLALVRRAINFERADRAFAEQRAERKTHRRARPHFVAGGGDGVRQAHAAVFRLGGDARPARLGPAAIGLAEAGRRDDDAVGQARALAVADNVERRDRLGGELARFADHRLGRGEIEVAEPALLDRRRKTGDMLERKEDVGDRRAIGHGVPRWTAAWVRRLTARSLSRP